MEIICDCCGHLAEETTVDMGIGAYEFWGARGVHHDYQTVSRCCEAEIVEGNCKLISKKIHVAKKQHGRKIMPGDRYERTTYRSYRSGKGSWYHSTKRKVA